MHSPPALPCALAAFAAGATLLQWMPVLPTSRVAGIVAATALVIAAALTCRARDSPRATGGRVAGDDRIAPVAGAIPFAGVVLLVRVILFAVGAGAAGFDYAAWRAVHRLAECLPAALEGVDLVVIGVIDELPQKTAQGSRFAFAVERVETKDAIIPRRLSLAWYASRRPATRADVPAALVPGERLPVTPADVPAALAPGERWQFVVRLKRPHGNVNPDGFDVEAWLLENNLRATGYVRADPGNRRLDAFAGRPGDYIERARAAVQARILAALSDAPYAGVIVALTIGEQRAISEAQWQVFSRTGITHLVSISGLHVTVFAALAGGFAFAIARRFPWFTSRLPARKLAAAIGLVAATCYVLLAGAQIPALRTLIMLAVAALGIWLARPGTALMVWLWALVAVVAFDPWAGLTPGFWLSFGAVGLLLYGGGGQIGDARPRERSARIIAMLADAAHAQTLVTVGLVPLTLAIFQQVSLVAPLANALAIPVVTFGVVPLALSGIALPFDFIWHVAHAIFAALMLVLEFLARSPAAVWQQHAPLPWTIAAAMLGVVWLAAPAAVPGRWLGLVWLVPLFVVRPEAPAAGTFTMSVLDVGQGLAVVLRTHSRALLYDTGPRYTDDADAGGRIVAPYLRGAGIRKLDGLIVSHQDSDHSGGALTLLRTVPVDWLASSLPADHPILARDESGEAGEASRIPALRCLAGQSWSWDGVQFTILHPDSRAYGQAARKTNDLSCTLRVDSLYGSALVTGDIEAKSEQELLRRDARALPADVLVVPHHGSRTSSTSAFIAAVAPEVAVFTPGYRNRFGHPRPDVVARYADFGAALYRTDHDGALTFTFAPGESRAPRLEREHRRRYWRDMPLREAPVSPE